MEPEQNKLTSHCIKAFIDDAFKQVFVGGEEVLDLEKIMHGLHSLQRYLELYGFVLHKHPNSSIKSLKELEDSGFGNVEENLKSKECGNCSCNCHNNWSPAIDKKEDNMSDSCSKTPEKLLKITPEQKIDSELVQIKASKSEIERRIAAFIDKKRMEVDEFNKREFCSNLGPVIDTEESCARVDSVFVTRADSKSHIKVRRVVNLYGPQTQIQTDAGTSSKQAVDGVEERLKNMENHLKIEENKTTDSKDVYKRLQILEERILYLESLSPEYFGYIPPHKKSKRNLSSSDNQHTLNSRENLSILDIDRKIHELSASLRNKSTQSR